MKNSIFTICVQHEDDDDIITIEATARMKQLVSCFEPPGGKVDIVLPCFDKEKKTLMNWKEVKENIVLLEVDNLGLLDKLLHLSISKKPIAVFVKKGWQPKQLYEIPVFEIDQSDYCFCYPRFRKKASAWFEIGQTKRPKSELKKSHPHPQEPVESMVHLNNENDKFRDGLSSQLQQKEHHNHTPNKEQAQMDENRGFSMLNGFMGVVKYIFVSETCVDKVRIALNESHSWLDAECKVTPCFHDFIRVIENCDMKEVQKVAKTVTSFLNEEKVVQENCNILLILAATSLSIKMKGTLVTQHRPLNSAIYDRVSALPIARSEFTLLTQLKQAGKEKWFESQFDCLENIGRRLYASSQKKYSFSTKLCWLRSHYLGANINHILDIILKLELDKQYLEASFDNLHTFLNPCDMFFLCLSLVPDMKLFTTTFCKIKGECCQIQFQEKEKLLLIIKRAGNPNAVTRRDWKDFIDIVPKLSYSAEDYKASIYEAVCGHSRSTTISYLMIVYEETDKSHPDIRIIRRYLAERVNRLLKENFSYPLDYTDLHLEVLKYLDHPMSDEFLSDAYLQDSLMSFIFQKVSFQTIIAFTFQFMSKVNSFIQRNKDRIDPKLNTIDENLSVWVDAVCRKGIEFKEFSIIYRMAREDSLFFKGLERKRQLLLARNLIPDGCLIFIEKGALKELMCFPADTVDPNEFFGLLVDQWKNINAPDIRSAVYLHLDARSHFKDPLCYCCNISECIAAKATHTWRPKSFLDIFQLDVNTMKFLHKISPINVIVQSCTKEWLHRIKTENWTLNLLEECFKLHSSDSSEKERLISSMADSDIPSLKDIQELIQGYKKSSQKVNDLLHVNKIKLVQLFRQDFNIILQHNDDVDSYFLKYENPNYHPTMRMLAMDIIEIEEFRQRYAKETDVSAYFVSNSSSKIFRFLYRHHSAPDEFSLNNYLSAMERVITEMNNLLLGEISTKMMRAILAEVSIKFIPDELDIIHQCPAFISLDCNEENVLSAFSALDLRPSLLAFLNYCKLADFQFVHDDESFTKLSQMIDDEDNFEISAQSNLIAMGVRFAQLLDGNDNLLEALSDGTLKRALEMGTALNSHLEVWFLVRDMNWFGEEGLKHFNQEYENVTNILLFGDRASFEMTLLDALDPVVRSLAGIGGFMSTTLIDFIQCMRKMERFFSVCDIKLIQNNLSSIRQWFTDGLDDVAVAFQQFDNVLSTGIYILAGNELVLQYNRDQNEEHELCGAELVTFVNTLSLIKEENQKYSSHISTFIDIFCILKKASVILKRGKRENFTFPVSSLNIVEARTFFDHTLAETRVQDGELREFQSSHIMTLLLWEEELSDACDAIQTWITMGCQSRDHQIFLAIQRALIRIVLEPISEDSFWTFCSKNLTCELKTYEVVDKLIRWLWDDNKKESRYSVSPGIFLHQIEDCTAPTDVKTLILHIIQKIYESRLPSRHEIIDGSVQWSTRSLEIFLDRVCSFPSTYVFTLINAQDLPSDQQELILQFLSRQRSELCYSQLNLIQKGDSLLRSHPWIHEQIWENRNVERLSSDYLTGTFIKRVVVVSSTVCGSGKTSHVKNQSGNCASLIHIHEKTTLASLICSIQKLHSSSIGGHIHFSLNIEKFEVSDDILDMLNYFFQSLLITLSIYDPVSKSYFSFDHASWWIYLELPVIDNCKEWLHHHIPIIAECAEFMTPSKVFRIDSKARRVCTYLRAFEDGTIDRKFIKSSKTMLFVLDDSGSMVGEKMNAAVDNMIHIFRSHVQVDDTVGLIRFSDYVEDYLPITKIKSQNHKNDIAQNLTNARNGRWGGTRMYTALIEALNCIKRHTNHSIPHWSWIVCLTDGESADDDKNELENQLRLTRCEIQLVVVGVSLHFRYESYIRRLCSKLGSERNNNFIPTTSDREAINRAFNVVSNMIPVSQTFDFDGVVDDAACRVFITKYLPTSVDRADMMSTRFWVEFLYRRVKVFDENDDFNYNIKFDRLGSTLMTLMLQEVDRLLKPDQSSDGIEKCILQVIYDFHDVKSPKFRLLATAPELIDPETRSCLEELKLPGFSIPEIREKSTRNTLDQYLSQALKVPLNEFGRLSCIDTHGFVLTLDFTVKLICIHERVACGIPCVIEGETGVSKTALAKMYSLLINDSIMVNADAITQRQLLNVELQMITENVIQAAQKEDDVIGRLRSAIESSRTEKQDSRISQALIKGLLDECRKREPIYRDPPNELFEQDSIDTAIKFLEWFSESHLEQTFFDFKIDSSITEEDVETYFIKVEQTSKKLEASGGSVVVFLDEFNTSSIMGFLKGIVIDRNIGGRAIPKNLIFVCACNPHRATIYQGAYSREIDLGQEWVSGHYQVRKLPSSMNKLKWWYGALNAEQEKEFIFRRIQMLEDNIPPYIVGEMTEIMSMSQEMMRSLAAESIAKAKQKYKLSDNCIQETPRSRSVVSLRDIQRVFSLYDYIANDLSFIMEDVCEDDPQRCFMLITVYIVYYLRLDRRSRAHYLEKLEKFTRYKQQVLIAFFDRVLDIFVKNLKIPVGIAITQGFKENVFMVIICTLSYTPLIIVGPPGSSKTLSVNVVSDNANGEESPCAFFRHLPRISTFHYQCSKKSTSKEISSVFEKAINRQRKADKKKHRSLVFMDEAGLPEEEKESLKVLHYFLEGHMSTKAECGFIAITNHVLDAAKSNRCLSLLRQEPTDTEMIEITKGVLFQATYVTCVRYGKETMSCEEFSSRLAAAYSTLQTEPWFEIFFGLRDFIYMVKAIRAHAVMEEANVMITYAQLIVRSCERNFGGLGREKLHQIIDAFMTSLQNAESIEVRDTIEVLKECLESKSEHKSINLRPRYKLIIDETEDDSILRILSMKDFLPFSERITLSSFPEECDREQANFVSKVKLSASHNSRIIMSHADPVHECFYDLFNQNFRSLMNRDGSLILYSNIAMGGVSRRSKVHPDFECIVHVRGSDVPFLPAPFLNRFEKYHLDSQSVRRYYAKGFPNLAHIHSAAENEAHSFIETCSSRIGKKWIIGYIEEQTISSLLFDMVPVKTWNDFCNDVEHKRITQLVRWITGGQIIVNETECLHAYYEMIKLGLIEESRSSDHLMVSGDPPLLLFKVERERDVPCELSGAVERLVIGLISRDLILRLLSLATPEAIYELRTTVPGDIFEKYLSRDNKSLQNIVSRLILDRTHSLSKLCIIHTRTDENLRKAQPIATIFDDRVIYHQLHLIRTDPSLKSLMKDWLSHDRTDLLLLVADASHDSFDAINYIRVVVESEMKKGIHDTKKFILLIHYPSLEPRSRCYPSLFSGSWNHLFLDSIGTDGKFINIIEWIELSCCELRHFTKHVSIIKAILEASLPTLLPRLALNKGLLYQEQLQGKDDSICSRVDYLTIVLNQKVDGETRFLDCVIHKFICILSQDYIIDLIQRASQGLIHGRSRVSMTLAISSAFVELFVLFLHKQLSTVNRWQNLDILRNGPSSCQKIMPLFNKIFESFPQQSVEELLLRQFPQTDALTPLSGVRNLNASFDTLFPFFHFVSSMLNGVIRHIMREHRLVHQVEKASVEMNVVHTLVEDATALLNDEKVCLSKQDVTYGNSERYFKVALAVIHTVQEDCELYSLYIQQYAQEYFLVSRDTLAFRYLTERVSLLSETWTSLSRNIIVVHVIGNRDRMSLMKLVSLQNQGKNLISMTEPSFALSIDRWFHIHSINEFCEKWSVTLSAAENCSQLSVTLKESIAQIPFLMASGIGKKSENSGLQLRRLSFIHLIGQRNLPDKTLINVIRWIYTDDCLSLQGFFKLLGDEEVEMTKLINSAIFYFLSPQWLQCLDEFFKDDLAFVIQNLNVSSMSFSAILSSINKTKSPPNQRSLTFFSQFFSMIPFNYIEQFNNDGLRITVPRYISPWARSNSNLLDSKVGLASSESMNKALYYISLSSCDYSSTLADDFFIVILQIYSLEAERLQSNEIMFSILEDIDLEFSVSRKEQARLLRLKEMNKEKAQYKGSAIAPIIIEAKIVCFICKMAEEVCHGQLSPVINGLYSEASKDFVDVIMSCHFWREFFLLYVIKEQGQGFLIRSLSKGGPLHDLHWTQRWRAGLPINLEKHTESLSTAEKEYAVVVKDEEHKTETLRLCPSCRNTFEVHTMNCATFICGRDAHNNIGRGGYGCGHQFSFDSALRYQPDRNRLDISLQKRDEERKIFLKYQADASLWDQLQQKTLPIMVCRFSSPSTQRSFIPCAVFSDRIKKETHKYRILLYVVDNAHTIAHFDLLPHLIELYMWLQSTYSGFLSVKRHHA